ncbi:hypothetical protein JCM8097_005772 [Rhodosporidiobolus ruineniae]
MALSDDPSLAVQPALPKDKSASDEDLPRAKERSNSQASSISDVKSRAPLADPDGEPPSVGAAFLQSLGLKKRAKVYDLDAVATQESVFDGPLAEHYTLHEKYENKEAFDPSFRWTYREDRAVTRKVDIKIMIWVLVMFLLLDIDRGNLKNATADNLLKDINITKGDYNLGNTLFKLGFLTAELPSQMIGKRIGVDIWLPLQICIFSILSGAQFWLNGRTSFLAFRFAIAFFQGGFIPDVILYLSYFYTKNALPLRLALFWSINFFADFLTAFLAVGLLKMRGVLGHAGWRWMFLIEGIITLIGGIASFFMLAPSPSQTKTRWRPNGYFSDREVKIIVNRVVRDDPTKATMHNRQALNLSLLWKSLCDYDLWPLYVIGLTFGIAGYPLGNYFQLSMKELGFSTVNANLLSVPHIVISIFNLITLTLLSEAVNNRTWVSMIENWWFLIFYIPLVVLKDPISPWVWFALATLVLGYPYSHAIQVAWASRNAGSVRTRTVSASVYNMFVQVSGIIGANIYQANDAPRYVKGNTILLGIIALNLVVVYPGTFFYYKWRNAQKAKVWDKMTTEEKAHYLATTTDEGAKRLDFRFVY